MSSKPYLINGSTAITSGAFGYYIETLQQKVQQQQMQWHHILGQGSDLAAGALFTALALIYYHKVEQKYNTKLYDWTAPLSAGILCTFGEITGIMGDTFDPKDIAAYWLGAGVAYALHRTLATKTLEAKITPKPL
jgi:hypothetical protein